MAVRRKRFWLGLNLPSMRAIGMRIPTIARSCWQMQSAGASLTRQGVARAIEREHAGHDGVRRVVLAEAHERLRHRASADAHVREPLRAADQRRAVERSPEAAPRTAPARLTQCKLSRR